MTCISQFKYTEVYGGITVMFLAFSDCQLLIIAQIESNRIFVVQSEGKKTFQTL